MPALHRVEVGKMQKMRWTGSQRSEENTCARSQTAIIEMCSATIFIFFNFGLSVGFRALGLRRNWTQNNMQTLTAQWASSSSINWWK